MPTSSSSALRAAIAIGSEVPAGDFDGAVHSVFEAALNAAVDGRRMLVTLVGEDGDELPQGIRLRGTAGPAAHGLAPGMRARRLGWTLALGDGDEPLLRVDLATAVVAARVPPPAIDPDAEEPRARWARCAFHLDGLQEERDADLRLAVACGMAAPTTALGEHLAPAVRALAADVRRRDAAAAGLSAQALLGLGGGLTPTGDDFLVGLLAALWCASAGDDAERGFVRAFGAGLQGRLHTTTAISATYLECAITGCFPGALAALASAISGTSRAAPGGGARASLDRLCALGHSSGMDTATGFLFGLWLRTDDEARPYAP